MVLMVGVEIDLEIPATIPLAILDKAFMVKGEVDIGIRTSTLTPITQVSVVDF